MENRSYISKDGQLNNELLESLLPNGQGAIFRHALESISLSLLNSKVDPAIINEAIQTSLDALQNNHDKIDAIKLDVPSHVFSYDGVGIQAIDTASNFLSLDEIGHVIDAAEVLLISYRERGSADMEEYIEQLEIALIESDIIGPKSNSSHSLSVS
jgi:hypothetical protein